MAYSSHIYYLMWSLFSTNAHFLCIFTVSHLKFFLGIGYNHKKKYNQTIYPPSSLKNKEKKAMQ